MIRDMLRTRLADALAHTLATKPFELTPGEDLERQVNLAMADAVLVVVAEWLRERAADLDPPPLAGLVGALPAATLNEWYPVECEHGFDHCPKCDARPA